MSSSLIDAIYERNTALRAIQGLTMDETLGLPEQAQTPAPSVAQAQATRAPNIIIVTDDGRFFARRPDGHFARTPTIMTGDITYGSVREYADSTGNIQQGDIQFFDDGTRPNPRRAAENDLLVAPTREGPVSLDPVPDRIFRQAGIVEPLFLRTEYPPMTASAAEDVENAEETPEEAPMEDTATQAYKDAKAQDKKVKDLEEKLEGSGVDKEKIVKRYKKYMSLVDSMATQVSSVLKARGRDERDSNERLSSLQSDMHYRTLEHQRIKDSRLKLLRAKTALRRGLSREFDTTMDISWVDKYRTIELTRDTINFTTTEIFIDYLIQTVDAKQSEWVKVPVGAFRGTINLRDYSRSRVSNLTKKWKGCDHPHILDSKLCWGDFRISELILDYDIASLLPHFIMYLETYNSTSPHAKIHNWFKYLPPEDNICTYSGFFRKHKEGRHKDLVSKHKYCKRCDLALAQHNDICKLNVPVEVIHNFVTVGGFISPQVIDKVLATETLQKTMKNIIESYSGDSMIRRLMDFFSKTAIDIRNV